MSLSFLKCNGVPSIRIDGKMMKDFLGKGGSLSLEAITQMKDFAISLAPGMKKTIMTWPNIEVAGFIEEKQN